MKACLSSTEHFIWINSLKPHENHVKLPASSPFLWSKNSSTEGLNPHLRTHLSHPGTNRYYLDLNYSGLIINRYITVLCLFGEIEEYFHFTFLQVLKNTGVGSHSLLQGVLLTQGSNPSLLDCRQVLYHLSYQGSPSKEMIQKIIDVGLLWWLSHKESSCQCRSRGFDPWSGRIPQAVEQLSLYTTIIEPVL